MAVTERRLDVDESRRAFGDGTMKDTPPYVSPFVGLAERLPKPLNPMAIQAAESRRRERLARWQVPRV